ncbi:hypothetical protein AWC38_SpisGene24064 [Stylophora pistillata]|uniref:Uncharacterized protein n=1 Tax=Stylophora pistillata TaxID=50429 RepID=A0A2B4R6P4_STYPI|nr:hypothetical protein AWC38_SpisGene24064 [Stylophora pistillata]
MDDLDKIKSRIHHSILYDSYGSSEDDKNFNKVYNGVMTAFLDFVRYCEDKPPPQRFLCTDSNMFEHLDDNPRRCGVALDDLLRIVEKNADYDDYCRMQRHVNQYIQAYDPTQVEDDDDEQLFKLYADVMKAFLSYTQHCEQLYRKKLVDEQSSSNDDDEMFVASKKTENIKEDDKPEPFPEHLIAINLNS